MSLGVLALMVSKRIPRTRDAACTATDSAADSAGSVGLILVKVWEFNAVGGEKHHNGAQAARGRGLVPRELA